MKSCDEAVREATAATLRIVALWGDVPPEQLRTVAEQAENDDLEMCCPVCEEVECDAHCPLAPVRAQRT